MDDRELLELAARAAGRSIRWATSNIDDEPFSLKWNPLRSCDDALRLQVELGICVELDAQVCVAVIADEGIYEYGVSAWKVSAGTDVACDEAYGSDKLAAVRRAITRAAAAIAQEMTDAQG